MRHRQNGRGVGNGRTSRRRREDSLVAGRCFGSEEPHNREIDGTQGQPVARDKGEIIASTRPEILKRRNRQDRNVSLLERIIHGLEKITGTHFLDAKVYLMSDLPAKVQLGDVLQVSLLSLLLCLLATIYPAWRASRVLPAEALRHD